VLDTRKQGKQSIAAPRRSASHCKRTRPRKRTHGQSTCLRTSSRHWQTALWLGPAVSPVALSLHLSIVGAVDDDLGPQVFLKFKHVDFLSLPSFVSRSSTHFSQLISQIGPNWAKSGWHEEHSEVLTEVRIDWADSVIIKLNQRKKFKLALLLGGLKSKDAQFAVVKFPKCLEEPYNTYDRSTNSKIGS